MTAAPKPAGADAFGIYVHFPFCLSKCPYCDFATRVQADIPHRAWGVELAAELEAMAPHFEAGELRSIFFGGGTPSLWNPEEVGALVAAITARFRVHPQPEITLEANPRTVEAARFSAYREAGVNRLSLGVQSLNAGTLEALGRTHSPDEARRAVEVARAAGFDNLSLDFIFGVEGQAPGAWRRDLEGALALEPDHLSLYALTPEPGTPLGERVRRGKTVLPGEDTVSQMLRASAELCGAVGLERYEVSNYGRPGRECQHNLLYWRRRPYLGIGSAAHSFAGHWRWANSRSPDIWLAANKRGEDAGPPPAWAGFSETLDEATIWRERVLTGMRLREGTRLPDTALAEHTEALDELQGNGWLRTRPEGEGWTRLEPTPLGLDFSDALAVALF